MTSRKKKQATAARKKTAPRSESAAAPPDAAPAAVETASAPDLGGEAEATAPAKARDEANGEPGGDDEDGADAPATHHAASDADGPPGVHGDDAEPSESAPAAQDAAQDDEDGEWPETPDSVVPPAPAGPDDGPDEVVTSLAGFRWPDDVDVTVNLTGGLPALYERDDLAEGGAHDVVIIDSGATGETEDVTETHLRGLVEALVFASDSPVRPAELARRAESTTKEIRRVLASLRATYLGRGIQLDEVGGAWVFRTNPVYAPFVRELTGQKPVKLTRAQIETLSILAYRQPITRPEIDDIRGVDSGPVLKMLLERDLIKILGKKDEPGRPILYGTTPQFLEFFGIASLKDLPTLREFTELNDDSKRVIERELGEPYEEPAPEGETLAPEEDPASPSEDLGLPEEGTTAPADELVGDTRVDEALAELERASLATEADPEESALGDALAAAADEAAGAAGDDDAPDVLGGDDDDADDDGFDLGDEEPEAGDVGEGPGDDDDDA
ncbi:MAG TPA: SMC-Scp complex subunit ScpB [Polyangiaceae bacterium]|nr:SMC-Scp complex subunit ScpB [Polyangiaceae bacterium]